jgi:hypothetical protein
LRTAGCPCGSLATSTARSLRAPNGHLVRRTQAVRREGVVDGGSEVHLRKLAARFLERLSDSHPRTQHLSGEPIGDRRLLAFVPQRVVCSAPATAPPSRERKRVVSRLAIHDSEGGILGGSRWARPVWATGGSSSCGRRVAARPPAPGGKGRGRLAGAGRRGIDVQRGVASRRIDPATGLSP